MRIIGFPTATPGSDDYMAMDNFETGTHSISIPDLAVALLNYTTDGYKIKLVDELPAVDNRDPKTLYFLKKAEEDL